MGYIDRSWGGGAPWGAKGPAMRDFQRVLLVCLGLCFAQRAVAQNRPTMTCGTYGGLACPVGACSAGMTQTSADGPGTNALWDASADPGELAVPTFSK